MEESFVFISSSSILSLLFICILLYSYYRKVIQKNEYIDALEKSLHVLEKSISETRDYTTLEPLLKRELKKIFQIQLTFLHLYSEISKNDYFSLVREFFHKYSHEGFLEMSDEFLAEIEDEVFRKKMEREIPDDIAYIFPIYSTQGFHIGNLVLGKKISPDVYLQDEIEFLKEFSFFVEIHLKYIRTYTLFHEFSILLDEKADEKTIAYNNLLNHQKEFIKLISHEVRSPLTTTLFQIESIRENCSKQIIDKKEVLKELEELQGQLIRTSSLISKLFSVEYYENKNVSLFREVIHLAQYLEFEIELIARVKSDIRFLSKIDSDIGFVALDKMQFQQVITNLLDNAMKFAKEEDPTVYLSARKEGETIIITVEDNGKGFTEISVKEVFDKYSTRRNNNVGLGLGLYLCKKIVELHNGTIIPGNSEKFGGACFTINIPLGAPNINYSKT